MSTEDSKDMSTSETVIRCDSTPVAPLKHQHSFEQRYAALINQQILENTINKEVLHRQVQAFFPFSRSASKECQNVTKVSGKRKSSQENKQEEEDKEEEQEELEDTDNDVKDENEELKDTDNEDVKVLQKLETLDIADKEQT